MNDFYHVFNQFKNEIIDKVIFPCLALTPKEATYFYDDPEEFIMFSLQVVERDLKSSAKRMGQTTKEAEDEDD
jgi:hypothetical protein